MKVRKSNIFLIVIIIYSSLIIINPNVIFLQIFNIQSISLIIFINIFILFILIFFGIYYRLEESLISSKELSFIAIYSAFTAVSRIPFVGLPNIQPCSYLIFCAGFVFGPLIGFIVGVNTAIISNIFLGQGLFTLYQMIGWGLIGLVGGLIYFLYDQKHLNDYNRWILSTIGFILGFCYGWILNLSYWIMLPPPLTFKLFLGLCISSFYFDLLHGLSNFIFIFFFGNKTINILKRYRQRFLIVFKNKKIISERKKKEKIEN